MNVPPNTNLHGKEDAIYTGEKTLMAVLRVTFTYVYTCILSWQFYSVIVFHNSEHVCNTLDFLLNATSNHFFTFSDVVFIHSGEKNVLRTISYQETI